MTSRCLVRGGGVAAAALLLAMGTVHAQPAPAEPTEALAQLGQLAWLGGCWRSDGAEAGTVEHWLPPAAGTMLGMSRTVRRGRTVTHEFMQIRPGEDGRLAFIAQPAGQAPTRFPVLRVDAGEVVFENPAHDFPQRVIYRQDAPGHLRARIEGVRNGVARGIDFPMTKAPCDSPP